MRWIHTDLIGFIRLVIVRLFLISWTALSFRNSINDTHRDLVLLGKSTDLRRHLKLNKLAVRVRYELAERRKGVLKMAILGRMEP